MIKYDTLVQHLKYRVLQSVARHYWEGDLTESITEILKPRLCREKKQRCVAACIRSALSLRNA